jgi:predicted phosphate transport protein (TIGR00153 family)
MLGWFQALMPREEKFFDYFNAHAQTLVAGSRALRSVLEGGADISAPCAAVMAYENDADKITQDVMLAVRRTFITPFDRGDIQDLIALMDDAIDQMQQTVKAITLFELHEFDPIMRNMGDLIVNASDLSVELIADLSDMRKNAARMTSIAHQMTHLEEQADQLHDQGIKKLFTAYRHSDAMAYVIGAEIYSHLEKVVDRFEDIANRVNGILIEHI